MNFIIILVIEYYVRCVYCKNLVLNLVTQGIQYNITRLYTVDLGFIQTLKNTVDSR